MGTMVSIRPLRPGEGTTLRELRLQALREAPQAFFWSLETEEAIPAEKWEEWTDAPANNRIMFVAEEDGRWLGMAGCSLRGDEAGTLDATGMWVAPEARGRNLGERLIDAIMEWGRGRGAKTMEFAVTEDNEVAIALYRRVGFVPTGRRRALESNPQLVGMFMAKSLRQ
jgi:ribosomal protein S18 acetylase RimI-like enzyme